MIGQGAPMTTLEQLQLEAVMRGLTLEALMAQYRGTDTELGAAIMEVDVASIQDFALHCMKSWAETERFH